MSRPWIDVVYGTRPEAIKCAPLVAELQRRDTLRTTVTVTGQHREMVAEINASFGIRPDVDLDMFRSGATLAETTSTIFSALSARWAGSAPDAVVVQGDTASAALAAVAAYYAGARVIHLEAGLRSGDLRSPFPEEGNRRLIAPLAALHLAPTDAAVRNLRAEGIRPDDIVLTGNTGIDALHRQRTPPQRFDDPALERIASGSERLVLVTAHRRESWGGPLGRVASAVAEVVAARGDVVAVLPLHPNPRVRTEVRAAVGDTDRVLLCDPLPTPSSVGCSRGRTAPSPTPAACRRKRPRSGCRRWSSATHTERGEGVAAGAARLIGTRRETVVAELSALLDDPAVHARMSRAQNLYGDGRAAPRRSTPSRGSWASRRRSAMTPCWWAERSAVDHGDQFVQERREARRAPHDPLHAVALAEHLDELLEHRLERLAVGLAERHESDDLHAPLAPGDRGVGDPDRDARLRRGHPHRVGDGERVGERRRRDPLALDGAVDVRLVDDPRSTSNPPRRRMTPASPVVASTPRTKASGAK